METIPSDTTSYEVEAKQEEALFLLEVNIEKMLAKMNKKDASLFRKQLNKILDRSYIY